MNSNRLSTGTIILIILAALVGYFFGNAMNATLGGVVIGGGPIWGLIIAVITAVLAYVVSMRTENTAIDVPENRLSNFLFRDPRSSVLWLPLRIFVGLDWLSAGLGKLGEDSWMNGGSALQGYWKSAVAVPTPPAHAAITYDWWRSILQSLLDSHAYTWFGPLVAIGETLVGLGLIFGTLVGIAAFFGILMNTTYLLTGSTSSNPILLLMGILLILAWKVAGWIGLDRWLLPLLGTPWRPGALLGGPGIAPAPSPPARPGVAGPSA